MAFTPFYIISDKYILLSFSNILIKSNSEFVKMIIGPHIKITIVPLISKKCCYRAFGENEIISFEEYYLDRKNNYAFVKQK